MKATALSIRAGSTARTILRERGFDRDAFGAMLGAAGGPKSLVLTRLDHVLVEQVIRNRTKPLALLGTSIGAFRHACMAQPDPIAALDRFEDAYIDQAYETRPQPEDVSAQSERILESAIGPDGAAAIADHPVLQTHVGTSRAKGLNTADRRGVLSAGLVIAALANAASRRALAAFYERVVFHTGAASAFSFKDFPTRHAKLTATNIKRALAASGSIPLVMAAVRDIEGAPGGTYRDGGITDYHFSLNFNAPDGLILYPHFFERIIPGWFDKGLPWRRPRSSDLDRVLFLAPSPSFIAGMPGGKVPDRTDFEKMTTAERQKSWRGAIAACARLADEFNDLIESGTLADNITPFA